MRISPISFNQNVSFKSKLPPVLDDQNSTVKDYWGTFAGECLKDTINRENLNFSLKALSCNHDNGILALDVLKYQDKPDEYRFSLYKNANDIVLDKESSTEKPKLERSLGSIRLYKDPGTKSYVSVISDDKSSFHTVLKPDLVSSLLTILRKITYYGSSENKALFNNDTKYANPELFLNEYR